MNIKQFEITVGPYPRGLHLITDQIEGVVNKAIVECGVCQIFCKHTSASLTINENADPDVRLDLKDALDDLAPENEKYRHSDEGPDDMPAHVKSTITGLDMMIPITQGRLNLGRWQGVYLCEHRDHAGPREIVVTVIGK